MESTNRQKIWRLLQPSKISQRRQMLAKAFTPQHHTSGPLHAIPVQWQVQFEMQLFARGPSQNFQSYERRDHLPTPAYFLMTLGPASSKAGWTGLLSKLSTKSSLRLYVQLWWTHVPCQLWTASTPSTLLAPLQTSTSQFERCPRHPNSSPA
jgi:hypothetical protein